MSGRAPRGMSWLGSLEALNAAIALGALVVPPVGSVVKLDYDFFNGPDGMTLPSPVTGTSRYGIRTRLLGCLIHVSAIAEVVSVPGDDVSACVLMPHG